MTNYAGKKVLALATLVVLGSGVSGLVVAQTANATPSANQPISTTPIAGDGASTMPDSSSGSTDKDFVMKASAAGDTEIAASLLAKTHSNTPAVKQLAAMIIHDHRAANQQLEKLVGAQKGLSVASGPDAAQKADIDKLDALKGAAFDKAYIAMMDKDHHGAVTLFTQESSMTQNAGLKSFATATLPTLKQHLEMTQKLE